MNPNVYIAYLCLSENGSLIRERFKRWMRSRNSMEMATYCSDFKWSIRGIRAERINLAKAKFILEEQRVWEEFSESDFMEFLSQYSTPNVLD